MNEKGEKKKGKKKKSSLLREMVVVGVCFHTSA
jgi:hypothetical protein